MKKILLPMAVVVVFVAAALGVYFGIVNKNSVDLSITMENMTVNVGETVKINYQCSNKDAEVMFESKNSEIAEIVTFGSVYYVKGVKAGKVSISGTFTYGKYRNSKQATVDVVESSETVDSDEFDINNIEIGNLSTNLTYENLVFTLSSETGSFTIKAANGFEITSQNISCTNENININCQDIPGAKLYIISCGESVTYNLTISINGKTKTFTLICE